MLLTLEEMKKYLRVDSSDDDALITGLMGAAEKLCRDILRKDEAGLLESLESGKIAVMYATAYLYEHREDADHMALTLTLRALLFGDREVGF